MLQWRQSSPPPSRVGMPKQMTHLCAWGCFTLHERNEIQLDWAEHEQAGADVVPQPFPREVGGAEVAVHPPGATRLSLLNKGQGHGRTCLSLTDSHALSLPSRLTPATQPCQDMCPAENL